ncbi:1268_t:CDS:2, partial [Entrophospora sp. SA101]
TEKAKYYEELKNYADMGLEIEDNRVFEPMEIDYAIINLANKLDQPEGLSNSPSPSINVVRTPRVNTRPFQRKCEICKKLGHTYHSCPVIKNMISNSRKRTGHVNFANGFQQSHSDTEEIPDESAISDQEGNDEIDDDVPDKESNVNIIQSELENSALLEGIIRRIIQNSNPADNLPQGKTEDEEIIEDMEINFVQDKDVIDVPTVRGKINCLVLSAITVDPGSNTLLMSRDIAECLGLKINKSTTHYFKGAATVLTKSIGMVYNVPLTLAPSCVFHLDFAVIEYEKSMVIL